MRRLEQLADIANAQPETPEETWRQHIIITAVKMYSVLHPAEMEDNHKYKIYLRETAVDSDMSEVLGQEMRAMYTMPSGLYAMINELIDYFIPEETFFLQGHDGELEWFLSKFPQFRIPNKI